MWDGTAGSWGVCMSTVVMLCWLADCHHVSVRSGPPTSRSLDRMSGARGLWRETPKGRSRSGQGQAPDLNLGLTLKGEGEGGEIR